MLVIYKINTICSAIIKFINEKQKEQNMKEEIPTIIIDRQIIENLMIGLSNYPSNCPSNYSSNYLFNVKYDECIAYKSKTQMIKYGNKFYKLDRFNKEEELLYHWLGPFDHILLDFEKNNLQR